MPNRLDPCQDLHSVGPDLGLYCLQRLSADNKWPLAWRVNFLFQQKQLT